LIIGGGVIGCGVAWELARRGARVTVLERSVPGAEASSAAAGILGAQLEAENPGPLFTLALASRKRYPVWARRLAAETGIDIEHRASGVLEVALGAAELRRLRQRFALQARVGARIEPLDRRALRRVHPVITERAAGAILLPEDARVDPPALLRALRVASERAGARFRTGAFVRRVVVRDQRARGVLLDDGSVLEAERVVVAAGSWSSLVEGAELPPGGVTPARGQMVELGLPCPLFTPVLHGPRCYLVPRDDGRVLVGSTLEFVGFRREVTAGAVRALLDAAIELVPALADATLLRTWSSFRPYTRDGLPVIGSAGIDGLVMATGHHRNGVLLAPITAEIVAALVLGARPPLAIQAFSPARGGNGKEPLSAPSAPKRAARRETARA